MLFDLYSTDTSLGAEGRRRCIRHSHCLLAADSIFGTIKYKESKGNQFKKKVFFKFKSIHIYYLINCHYVSEGRHNIALTMQCECIFFFWCCKHLFKKMPMEGETWDSKNRVIYRNKMYWTKKKRHHRHCRREDSGKLFTGHL